MTFVATESLIIENWINLTTHMIRRYEADEIIIADVLNLLETDDEELDHYQWFKIPQEYYSIIKSEEFYSKYLILYGLIDMEYYIARRLNIQDQ
jgi:hypothetical protein